MSVTSDGARPTAVDLPTGAATRPTGDGATIGGRADPSTKRLRWAAASAALLALVCASLDAHGRASRIPFDPPPELMGRPWASTGDAAGAVRVWLTSGVRGRRLLVLTGRWSRPRTLRDAPMGEADVARARSGPLDYLDADAALWMAGTRGIARILDVVMPPEAYARRVSEVSGSRAFRPRDGGFALPFDALERYFATPDGYRPSSESVVVLVEPSFFAPGAPPDVPRWLRRLGVQFDLALIALEDPAATDDQRAQARRLVDEIHAPFVEAAE